jgi:hypothetical protein
MKKIFLFNACLIISIALFSQKQFLNTSYKLQKHSIKIAIIPFLQNDKLYTQAIFDDLMKDSLSSVKLADLDIVVHNIVTDSLTNASLNKIINKQYTNEELRDHPNLSLLLRAETISYLKQMLDGSDILLIPSGIKSRTVTKINGTGNTTMYGRFSLYDLNSGDLIFDLPAANKVNYLITDDEVRKQMEVLLESFHPYYFKNFIARNNIS